MTGLLKDLMHDRTDRLEAPLVDLDRITREGERRVRRRTGTLVGGVAAASAVAVLAGAAVLDRVPDRPVVADGTTGAPEVLSWTAGSVLHREGLPDVDLGVAPRAWLWADDVLVLTDADHRVRTWSDGGLDTVGSTAVPGPDAVELVADDSLVAWVGSDGRVVRHDTATGEQVLAPELPGGGARVAAVDGATVYVTTDSGAYAWRPTTESWTTLPLAPGGEVLDVESGTVVAQEPGGGTVVLRGDVRTSVPADDVADLAPGGQRLAVEDADVGRLVDARTGDALPFDHGHQWAVGYQWLTQDRVAVLAFDGLDTPQESARLLTCDATTGGCTDSDQAVDADHLQLPIGVHFAD